MNVRIREFWELAPEEFWEAFYYVVMGAAQSVDNKDIERFQREFQRNKERRKRGIS